MARERNPESGQWIRQTLRERFDPLVDKSGGPEACWPWLGIIESTGYGRLTDFRKKHSAHRLAYIFEHGEIPEGKHICHSCDNRRCVNPAHLWAGSARENMQDMLAKGRRKAGTSHVNTPKGEAQHLSKLTEADVLAIRAAWSNLRSTGSKMHRGINPASIAGLAIQYGVSRSAVYAVVSRKTWKHI
jgi:hypothetical protein